MSRLKAIAYSTESFSGEEVSEPIGVRLVDENGTTVANADMTIEGAEAFINGLRKALEHIKAPSPRMRRLAETLRRAHVKGLKS